jgi:hypothetical protein
VLDAGAIAVLLDRKTRHGRSAALRARWTGESVNSLLPAGQIGGPVLMVRYLSQRGARMRDAAAAITVSTTTQALAQMASRCSAFRVQRAGQPVGPAHAGIIVVTVVLARLRAGVLRAAAARAVRPRAAHRVEAVRRRLVALARAPTPWTMRSASCIATAARSQSASH